MSDEIFEAEFMAWWEEHGQYCRTGGGDYERTFAFQAWRHLYPKLLQARAPLYPAHIEDGEEVEVVAWADPSDLNLMRRHGHTSCVVKAAQDPCCSEPLMTVALHQRIVAALSAPPAGVPEKVLRMLSELQWHWRDYDDHWHTPMGFYCPECGGEKDQGHQENCDLAALLTTAPTPPASGQRNLCPHDSWRYGGGPCSDCGEVQFSEEELLRLNRPASEQQHDGRLPSELEVLTKDAERYRWLRTYCYGALTDYEMSDLFSQNDEIIDEKIDELRAPDAAIREVALSTPPASEQQRAVVMPDGLREAMGKAASSWLYENDPQGLDWCDPRNVDALLEALFEAAPHLAKGEGV